MFQRVAAERTVALHHGHVLQDIVRHLRLMYRDALRYSLAHDAGWDETVATYQRLMVFRHALRGWFTGPSSREHPGVGLAA